MLAGVIKSPGRYSPRIDEAAAKQRRHTVLAQMRDQGYIDAAAYARGGREGVQARGRRRRSPRSAPYFVEYVKNDARGASSARTSCTAAA